MPEPTTTPVALRAQRERTIRALCDHFAADRLEVADFERRLDVANRAATPAELESLTADLVPAQAAPSMPPAPAAQPAGAALERPSLRSRAHQLIVGIMGGATRRGRWTPAQESTAIGVMGGVMLDFRQAQLPPGETVVHAFALMGGVTIFVPPELDVAVNGVGIMGGFDHMNQAAAVASPDAPRLRVDGVAIMGGVDVQVKSAGEPSPWDSMHVGITAGHGKRHEAKQRLREGRQQLKEEARRLKDEWRGQR